ncbi:tRNA(Ile)-lysidine synthase [Streptococcus himalayensis]|uniref:tRNA(Ile)-lysidine synthase n=2 Tax=Streptococcus himalayensis TaxID=1888195 RepID=A0A917EE10_9STRE|nr:tRNA(Ile)-lysidine synthase [Streptococcus himalayensis]
MEKKILASIQKKGYFKDHRRVLVALSGGLDSMTLFEILYRHQRELDIEVLVAHVNHKQRPESDTEERLLKAKMEKLGVEMATSSFSGVFSEERARKFRYDFFKTVMEEKHCTALVTAHHQDDQAETIFMRLLRGSRLRHLMGIPERQVFGQGELIRPLLSFRKSDFPEIEHFVDKTNAENHYLRNRIRNLYLPALERENLQVSQHLVDLSDEVSNIYQSLSYFIREIDLTSVPTFQSYPDFIQTILLQEYLANFPDVAISKAQFKEILHILQKSGNYRHHVKNDYVLIKDYATFRLEKISLRADENAGSFLLEYGNTLEYGGYLFSFGKPLATRASWEILVSRETPLLLRHRKAGDYLLYRGHRKKVRRLFIDKKLSLKEREEAIIVEQAKEIRTIVGIAVSDLSQRGKSDIINGKLYIQKIE